LKIKAFFVVYPPELENDIIASVSEFIIKEIKREVSEAVFVALVLDEATDIDGSSDIICNEIRDQE
jgi:hypothetical protein